MVADPKALHYILHASGYDFPKTTDMLKVTEMLTGKALVCAHGGDHLSFPCISPFAITGLMMYFTCSRQGP
jgi:hypothetical protein